MRSIKKRLWLRRLVLVIGAAAIAMPTVARVSLTSAAAVIERQARLAQPTGNDNEDANAKYSKPAVGRAVARQDDYYYERRRRYWKDRVEGRLDREEEETGDDKDAKDSKNSKAKGGEDDADSVDKEDSQEDAIERRREYWRDRLDREW